MRYMVRSLITATALAASIAIVPVHAADTAAGKKNYDSMCANCHGAAGGGDGSAASGLPAKPTNFTDCAKISKISDDTLFKATKEGGAAVGLSPMMPPSGSALSDDQVKDIVAYIRTFCKH